MKKRRQNKNCLIQARIGYLDFSSVDVALGIEFAGCSMVDTVVTFEIFFSGSIRYSSSTWSSLKPERMNVDSLRISDLRNAVPRIFSDIETSDLSFLYFT